MLVRRVELLLASPVPRPRKPPLGLGVCPGVGRCKLPASQPCLLAGCLPLHDSLQPEAVQHLQ